MQANRNSDMQQNPNAPARDLGPVSGDAEDQRLRLVHTDKRGALIYYLEDYDEWCIKFFLNGIYQIEGDYHTDDELDALATARYWINC